MHTVLPVVIKSHTYTHTHTHMHTQTDTHIYIYKHACRQGKRKNSQKSTASSRGA